MSQSPIQQLILPSIDIGNTGSGNTNAEGMMESETQGHTEWQFGIHRWKGNGIERNTVAERMAAMETQAQRKKEWERNTSTVRMSETETRAHREWQSGKHEAIQNDNAG